VREELGSGPTWIASGGRGAMWRMEAAAMAAVEEFWWCTMAGQR
jgi:hypothetical protein